jgi:predicted phosphodiesterase
MVISRREFLKGALASLGMGAFGPVFAAPPGWRRPAKANLVFGLVSDTHLRTDMTGGRLASPDGYLLAALRHFREQGVDAVAHCGDMADRGQIAELEFHAEIWRRVFGDGGPVKLFVAGNHDIEGFRYGLGRQMRVDRIYPDPEEMTTHLLAADFAAAWERVWGEKYERVWHKTVKGYHFFGRHWDVDESELAKALEGFAADGANPFFLLSHECSMKLADSPLDLKSAVGFFGHWHCTGSNWNQIHFFPGYSFPNIQVPSSSSYGRFGFGKDAYISKAPLEGADAAKKGYQGYVVRVYDDFLAIERREFSEGGSLGPDWIMPLGKYEVHPFAKSELKKVVGVPQFRAGAKLETESTSETLRLKIPLADGNPDSRAYAYELAIEGGGKRLLKAVYCAGAHMGIGHEPDGGWTMLTISAAELPSGGTLAVSAVPLSSLGTRGAAITERIEVAS